jgi:hypothetical protein
MCCKVCDFYIAPTSKIYLALSHEHIFAVTTFYDVMVLTVYIVLFNVIVHTLLR